jgi:GGDEF domain-containing protein
MPTDLLLPAFALTLLANAILVAVAIRALRARTDRDGDDRLPERVRSEVRSSSSAAAPPAVDRKPAVRGKPRPTATPEDSPPTAAPLREASAPPTAAAEPEASTPSEASPVDPDPRPRGTPPSSAKPASRRGASGDPPTKPANDRKGPAAPRAKPPAKRRAKPDTGASSRNSEAPRGAGLRGGRRRFSLPPLDDDSDRVIRSIETFFLGGEPTDTSEADAASAALATTVAVVAIDGLAPSSSRQEREAFDAAVATVERALRGAARATDRVTTTGRGRFRIVLPATGELAARAYLRRVRATVEPSLGSADIPLGIVTATSTVLDEAAGVAITQAEARLDTALASAPTRGPGRRPKAAAD